MSFESWHLSSSTHTIRSTLILITSILLPYLFTASSFYFGISGLKTIQQMSPKTKAILLTIGIVLLGFFREYLFININWIYLTLVNGRMNQALDEFHFLLSWSPSELILLKWGLTALFTVWFFALTWWIIKLVFNEKKLYKISRIPLSCPNWHSRNITCFRKDDPSIHFTLRCNTQPHVIGAIIHAFNDVIRVVYIF